MTLEARSCSPSDRLRRSPRLLDFTSVVLGVLASACATSASTEIASDQAAGLTFDRHEIVTGSSEHQTVLTGHFLGGAVADLGVVGVDANDHRRLSLYAFDGDGWTQRLEVALGPQVLFVDVARIGGRDRLLTYGPGRLSWFDPASATERLLIEVAIGYNASPSGLHYAGMEPTGPFDEGEVPWVDISRDVNHDGRDDLVIPGVDGFRVFVQTGDGGFAAPSKVGPVEPFRDAFGFDEKRSYGQVGLSPLTVPMYLSRVHEVDYNLDGRSDLVFWNGDHFEVHYQDARGLFDPVADTFTTDAPFDSDGAYSLAFAFRGASSFRLAFGLRKRTKYTMLHSFRDMDADGVADLVTFSVEGRSLIKQRSQYEVYFGAPAGDGISFSRHRSSAVRARVKAPPGGGYSSARLEDYNGDGRLDVGLMALRTGVGKMIRALLNRSISISFELATAENGGYPEEATVRRTVRSDIGIRGGRDAGFWPPVLTGDVNGDGSADLLVGRSRQELQLFVGGPDMLAREPQKIAVTLPGDERNSWLVDLDDDGKQDLLMHHPSTTEPHRVTILVPR